MSDDIREQAEAATTAAVEELPLNRNAVAIVPPKAMYDTYISRTVGGVSDMDMFTYALRTHTNVLIEGPTGAGKTSAALAFAARENMPFYATPSSIGLEPSQLFGRFIPTVGGGFEWQDGPVTHLVRYGGLLLINEANFIPPRVSTVLFSLFDKRRTIQLLDHRGEVITAHEDLLVVADMNPDYRGTTQLNAAFRNRFGIQQYWDYDPKVEEQLVPFKTLRDLATKIRQSEEIETPLGTNVLMDFVRHATSELGWQFAVTVFASKFGQDERGVVTQLLDLHTEKLRKEILKVVPTTVSQDDDREWDSDDYDVKVVGTKDNPNPINYPGYEPHMGIYNKDWFLEITEEEA